jgi:hypothetical protein
MREIALPVSVLACDISKNVTCIMIIALQMRGMTFAYAC